MNHVEVTVVSAVAAPVVEQLEKREPLAVCVCEALGLEGETVTVVEVLVMRGPREFSNPYRASIGGTVTVMAS